MLQVAVIRLRVEGTRLHLLPDFYEEASAARTASLSHPKLLSL